MQNLPPQDSHLADQTGGIDHLKPENDVCFSPEDIDILNEALDIVPELKICVQAVRLHRERKRPYPIADHDALFDLFEGEELAIANHVINRQQIDRYVPPSLFPITNDQALMRTIYLALAACNSDLNWAQMAPPHAHQLLREVRTDLSSTKGGK